MALPLNGTAYTFYITLVDAGDPSGFVIDPAIAAGDFKVSTDGSAQTDLDTLPIVSPAGSSNVLVTLSAAEMTGSKVTIQGVDVTGAQWEDVSVFVDVPDGTVETVLDIQQGDRTESNVLLVVKKRGTSTVVLSKSIVGSLLSPSVTVRTEGAP